MTEIKYEGFEELEMYGYISDYVIIEDGVWRPWVTLEDCGVFFPKGTKARFNNRNGYESERDLAYKVIGTERELTVKCCNIGRSSSSYTFEEIDGSWNTVMFDRI